jgi:hypothetical protein
MPYLNWSNEHRMWWRPNRGGYTHSLEAAGCYTREEAIKTCAFGRDGRGSHEIPPEMPVDEIDALECAERFSARAR